MSIKRTIITTIAVLAMVAVVAPVVASATTVSDLQAQINALLAQLQTLQGSTTTSTGTGACAGVTFTRNLTVGATGSDVKCLQVILNQSATTQVSVTGAGAPGLETSTFGPKTLVAVKKYQAANGMVPANQVGPMTRAKLNSALGGVVINPPVVTPTGSVSATLSSDNPASAAIVGGQAAADLLHVNFTGTGTITSVTLQRSGISDSNLFNAIYLYDGNTRITSGYSFNSNSQLVMNGLSIPVNGSHVISVRGDLASSVSNQSSATVTLVGLTANGVAGTVNVAGNSMTVVSGSLATATFSSDPTVVSPADATVNAGSTSQTLWSRTISISPRAVMLYGLTVKQIGSAPSNTIANAALYIDGVQVKTASINSNSQFVFDAASAPVTVSTGSHLLEVRGDVVAGSSRTFYLSLEQGSDISLKDSQLGVFIAPTYSSNTVSNANGGTITINGANGGSITVAQDVAFNSTTTLVGGASNVTMASFKFTAYGEDEKVTTLSFTPTISGTSTTLRNVGLYVNGAQVGSNQTATSASPLTFSNLGSNLIVPAGSSVIVSIKGDVVTSGGANYTTGAAQFDLVVGSNNAQGVSSSMFTSTAAAGGQSLTISSASSVNSFAGTTGFAVPSTSPNSTAKIGSFTLQAGSAEGLTVNNIAVTLTTDSATPRTTLVGANQITNLTVKNGSTVLGNIVGNPTASNNYSVNVPLAINSALVLDVYGDMGSSSNGLTVTPSMAVTYRGAVSNLSTTSSTVAGSQTTVGVPTIAYNGITAVNPKLTAQFVTASATPLQVVTFNFKTSNSIGGAVLKDLTFTTTSGTIQSVTVNGKTASVTSNAATVNDIGITVPSSASGVDVPVSVSFVCVGSGCSGVSNTTSILSLTKVTYNDGTAIKCVGLTCSTPTTAISAASASLSLVATVPTLSLTSSVGTLTTGTQQVGTFTVSAGSTGAIKVEKVPVVVSLNSTGGSIDASSIELRDASGNTLSNAPAALSASGTFDMSSDPTVIAAGGSVTYTVWAGITGPLGAAGASSLSFGLGAKANFKWTDVVGNVADIAGTNIYGYPTANQTLHN